VHNLHPKPVEFELQLDGQGAGGDKLIDIMDGGNSEADDKGRHTLLLDAYGYRWYRLGGLDYLLRRSEV
jgi:maltose alpha-D-glucosyltransferase/alpha-amylase